MRALQIVFSPTGGTKAVVDALFSGMPQNLLTKHIDLLDRDFDHARFECSDFDFALVAVPSFAGLVPGVAVQRIACFKGNGIPAAIVAVYGNRAFEDTLVQLQDCCNASGFKVAVAIAAISEHSIVRNFAHGRPDEDDRAVLASFGAEIYRALSSGIQFSSLTLPGNRPYKTALSFPIMPSSDGDCALCGICSARCPVGAITLDDLACTNPELCISCQACVKACPAQVRSVDPGRLSLLEERIRPFADGRKHNEIFLPEGVSNSRKGACL